MRCALVHLGAGIGNIVLATPLLQALHATGYNVDVYLTADYEESAALLQDWSVVRRVVAAWPPMGAYEAIVPAIPPFYWPQMRHRYRGISVVRRPPDPLFYEDEQRWYLAFATHLGWSKTDPLFTALPAGPTNHWGVTAETIVLAPGSKTGEMANKRWPHFVELAARFADVAVVGTADDMFTSTGDALHFPPRVRLLTGCLALRETAQVLASAGCVVANDTGLGHLASAVGTPTLLLFGPTPDVSLGKMPGHVVVLRSSLHCQPCWFRERYAACGGSIACLQDLSVSEVSKAIDALLAPPAPLT